MNLTPVSFLIVCPLLFLAGFVDAIGGGGGLITQRGEDRPAGDPGGAGASAD